jgi:hypothetical protein
MNEREPEQVGFEDELKSYLRAQPFHPIEIVMASGDRYEILDPWMVAITAGAIFVHTRIGTQMIRKNQITAVHVHEPSI